MKENKKGRLARVLCADLFLFGVCLVVFALFHHVLPREIGEELGSVSPPATFDDWSEKFPGVFAAAGEVESGEDFYRTDSVSITVKTVKENGVRYHLADVYLASLDHFRTAFAGKEFTFGAADSVLSMASENNAVLAVSGDYCGIREQSVVIRNGHVLRTKKAHEVCVIYQNGVMETFSFADFYAQAEIAKGVWQAWDFGPSLLEKDGAARTSFAPGIAGKNPRVAIGYYEPGHYVFVAVDGRQTASAGMTLPELAQLFASLGCKRAYNLDGGHSAVMVWQGRVYSSPSKANGRPISDILYVPVKEES